MKSWNLFHFLTIDLVMLTHAASSNDFACNLLTVREMKLKSMRNTLMSVPVWFLWRSVVRDGWLAVSLTGCFLCTLCHVTVSLASMWSLWLRCCDHSCQMLNYCLYLFWKLQCDLVSKHTVINEAFQYEKGLFFIMFWKTIYTILHKCVEKNIKKQQNTERWCIHRRV